MVKLTEVTITITYDQVLRSFKTNLNKNFPPKSTNTMHKRLHIKLFVYSTSSGRGWRHRQISVRNNFWRWNGEFWGIYHEHHGGRERGDAPHRRPNRTQIYSKTITLNTGQQVKYHKSFIFMGWIFQQMKKDDIDMLKRYWQ